MTTQEMIDIVMLCTFEGYTFTLAEDARGSIYLQGSYIDHDIVTKKPETQYTRKWLMSPAMTKSEITQTCFKLIMTSMEHRAREGFKYNGKRVYSPHFDVDALWQLCADKKLDVRP